MAYLTATEAADAVGLSATFAHEVLGPYLAADHLQPFLTAGVDLSNWEPRPLERSPVLEELQKYLPFAWDKAITHRGISAVRSVVKARAWLWLLGDDELFRFTMQGQNYPRYGAPILLAICRKYDFPIPTDPVAQKMAAGEPCRPGCDEGCRA